ncbi:MAG: translocation/assembly module TamB domain-containing protein [Deltaproteobacteria bacterium]
MRSKIILIILLLVILCAGAAAWYLLLTPQGLQYCARRYVKDLPAGNITVGRITGSLLAGARFYDLQISDIENIQGVVAKVQELKLTLRDLRFPKVEIKNGRFEFPTGEVISFAGTYDSGLLHFNVYSGLLYVQTVEQALSRLNIPEALRQVTGRMSGIDLFVSNTFSDLLINGTMQVEEARFRHITALNFPVKLDLNWRRARQQRLFGRIDARSGTLVTQFARMDVPEGWCEFTGDAALPRFKIHGETTVAGTRIKGLLAGTPDKPDLQLSSTPPLPQDRLMVMILTGQSWQGTETALTQGRFNPGVIKDFANFFLFGGSEAGLEKKLGITDIDIKYQGREKGVEVHKSITGSTDVIYGVSKGSPATQAPAAGTTQTLGLEYKVTHSLSVEGTKQLREKLTASGVKDQPESVIRLKYKKEF